jgi:hypothetical protein
MSNALAIAAVTETLVQVLGASLDGAQVAGAQVTALRPDAPSGLPPVGVNVFLYQVSPNPYLRNADLPTRAPDGSLLRRPQAALDLHYLLTFYGQDSRLEQQRLLGAVARKLHADPTLPRTIIAGVQQSVDFLNTANLDQQAELVRFTPVNFSLEELSKLWSFLLKVEYVLSVAYVASVVLIETDDPPPPPPLPVLASNIYAQPFRKPVIDSILSSPGASPFIVTGDPIALSGRNLVSPSAGSATRVMISGIEQTPTLAIDTRVVAALPSVLRAGAQSVQVVEGLMLGTPPTPHRGGLLSDVASFVLHPVIQKAGGGYAISKLTGVGSPPGDAVAVKVTPKVGRGQRGLLELIGTGAPPATHLFDAGPIDADTDTLTFAIQGLAPGHYLVRVRVDGAESPFDLDPSGAPVTPSIDL